mmetsp:Transcript_531/g.1816  ORF Transcript_531/g.1816 Transcript_531/m.1816 type:complete len:166 (+) Transcript_531:406-903(+)
MTVIKAARVVNLSIDEAWKMLSDFYNVNRIHPWVKTVDKLSEVERGEGAIRQCNFYDGNSAKEKIVNWDETNYSFSIVVQEASLPLKTATVHFTLSKLAPTRTKLEAQGNANMKYGMLGMLMGELVLKPKLSNALQAVFAGTEYYSTTQKEVPKNWKAPPSAVTA